MKHKIFGLLLILLAFTATIRADEGDWDFNPYNFQYDMTVYVGIDVDGSGGGDLSRYSVAAFCGEECRGVMEVEDAGGLRYGYLRIRSNKESGERITFKVYDNTAKVMTKCDDTIDFQTQGLQGIPSDPMTLHVANKYKVDYVVDGNVIHSAYVYYGEVLELIEAPKKTGRTFAEWLNAPQTMPASDVTVIGSYTVNSYTLTFKIGDELVSETTVAYGSEIIAPDIPEKEGHTFAGWDGLPETMPASDLTVNGSYTVNSYTLTYMIGKEIVSESEVKYGASLTAIEAPVKEGHSFDGWVGLPVTMPSKDVIVTGSYTVNAYTIIFKIDDEVVSQATVAYNSEIVVPAVPEKEGYTFGGWENLPETMPAGDLTIYGSYAVNSYTVTYMIEGEVIRVDIVDFGITLPKAPEAPEKQGYDFIGWSDIPVTMPAEEIIIIGKYQVATGINSVVSDTKTSDVYDLQGRLLKRNVILNKMTEYFPKGVYIINRRKVLIR